MTKCTVGKQSPFTPLLLSPMMAVYLTRREHVRQADKAKFFEPHLMSNPPPMAEQFLYDLRKMVAVARERIRTRRHIPRLHAIVESDDEGASNYSKQPNSWKDCDERKQQQQKPQRGEASPQQRTDDEPKKFEEYSDGKLQGKDGQKTKQYTGDEKARREAAAAATEKLESHSEDDQVGKGVNKGLKQLNDDNSSSVKSKEKMLKRSRSSSQKTLVNGGKVENNVDKLKQYSDYKPAWRDIVGREVKQLRNDENKKKQLEEKAEEADDDCSNLMQFGDEKVGENVEKKKVSNNAKVREANSKRLTDEEEPTTGKDVWKRIQQFNELRPHTEEENIRKNAETGTNQLSKDAKVGSDLGKGVQQQPKSDERVGKNVQKERKQFTDGESVGVNVRKKVHQFTDAKPPTADDEKVGKSAEKKLNQQLNDEQIGKKLRQLGSKEQIGRELFQDEKKLNKPTNDGQLSEDLGNGLKQYLYCQLNGKERMKPFKDEAPIKEEDCWDNKFKQSTDKQQFGEDCEVSKIDETKSEFCTNEAFRGNGGIPQKIKACEAPLEQNGIETSEINNSLALCSPKPATILNNDGTDKKDAGRGQLPKALEPNKTEAKDCTPSSSSPPRNELTRNPSEVIVENLSDDDTSTTPSSTSEAEDEGEKEDELTSLRIKTAATEAVNRKFVALAPAATPSSSAKLEQPPQQQQNQSLGASRIPIGVASTSGSNGSKLPRASLLKFGTVQKQSPAAVAEHQPPPLPPNPPPAEEEPKPRMKKSLLQQPNGSNSLTLMKRRGSAGASTAALTVEKFATDVGPSGSKNHHRTLLNNYRSAIPTSIPCPTTYSLNSNPPSASFPPSSVSYAVSPPDNHIKKSLPRRKKLNGANGGGVPPFAANGNGMATNLKMPTVV
uniref:WH2 domain-containing protein n=1 Tax=Globodera rostochiensis TaxID=31243 RepID=A0A914IBW9_GLORO